MIYYDRKMLDYHLPLFTSLYGPQKYDQLINFPYQFVLLFCELAAVFHDFVDRLVCLCMPGPQVWLVFWSGTQILVHDLHHFINSFMRLLNPVSSLQVVRPFCCLWLSCRCITSTRDSVWCPHNRFWPCWSSSIVSRLVLLTVCTSYFNLFWPETFLGFVISTIFHILNSNVTVGMCMVEVMGWSCCTLPIVILHLPIIPV